MNSPAADPVARPPIGISDSGATTDSSHPGSLPASIAGAARHEWRTIAFIVVVAIVLRVLLIVLWRGGTLLTQEQLRFNDGSYYAELATHLLETGSYAYEGKPTAFVMPGYPMLLALLFAVFGSHLVWVRLFQCLLGGLVCAQVYWTARPAGAAAAVFAATLAAVSPHFVEAPAVLGNQLISTMLVLAVVLVSRRLDAGHPWRNGASLGCLVALAVYMRPQAVLLLIVVAIYIAGWVAPARRAGAFRALGVAAVVVALALVPWMIRNYVVFNRVIPFASEVGLALWAPNNANAGDFLESGALTRPADVSNMNESAQMDWYLREVGAFALSDPVGFAALQARKFLMFWNPLPRPGYSQSHRWGHVLFETPLILLGAGAILWLMVAAGRYPGFRAVAGPLLLLVLAAYSAVHTVFPPKEGYRLPLTALIMVLLALVVRPDRQLSRE